MVMQKNKYIPLNACQYLSDNFFAFRLILFGLTGVLYNREGKQNSFSASGSCITAHKLLKVKKNKSIDCRKVFGRNLHGRGGKTVPKVV